MATTATAPVAPPSAPEHSAPEHSAPENDDIARLAYGYWLDRQESGEGSPEEDWLRAEQALQTAEQALQATDTSELRP